MKLRQLQQSPYNASDDKTTRRYFCPSVYNFPKKVIDRCGRHGRIDYCLAGVDRYTFETIIVRC
jgi:hypothetical protein